MKNHKGFTLLEIIAVLIIFGILVAAALHRYIDLEENAYRLAIDAAVSELNARESRIWAEVKESLKGWTSDNDIWIKITLDEKGTTHLGYPHLGEDYRWKGNKVNNDGDSMLSYKQERPVVLTRIPSTKNKPAWWEKKYRK